MKKVLVFVFFFFITFLNVYSKNEYLTNILIDGVSISEFDTNKTTYDLKYQSDKDKVNIVYEFNNEIYKGKGNSGDITLNYGLNEISYTLTSISDPSNTLTYKINITREDSRSSENSLKSLTVAGINVSLTDKLEYDVYVDNKLESVTLAAVRLSDKSTFVSGYGERLDNNKVLLTGETTKVEIKVKAQNESIKTYVINIIKKDYKSSDNTLKSLTIDKIDFSFKPSTYEYNLNVSNDIDKIKIDAIKNHEKATIDSKSEYDLKVGLNNILITVQAEDGTKKEYKLNITREESIPLVNDIKITDLEFQFDPLKYDYELETNLTTLDFKVTLNSESATTEILDNQNLKNNSVVVINVKDDIKTETYNFKIKNTEIENQELEEKVEENNQNANNSFLKKYEMYIGLGVFGLGLFSLLVAILTKPKSQIM